MTFGIQLESDIDTELYVSNINKKTVELRDWQRNAIKYFMEKKNVIFEVATGTGKTYCAIAIIKKLLKICPNYHFLIVVPKNVIMETGWYKELYDAGISLKNIGVFYGDIKEECQITITNMQSISKIEIDNYDVLIFDEIHNYVTPRLLKFVSKSRKYKLGLSATITRKDGNHWKLLEIFNYNVFKYSPEQALFDEVLNQFGFTNVGIEMTSAKLEEYQEITQALNNMFLIGGGFNNIMRTESILKLSMLSKLTERKELINNYAGKFQAVRDICFKHRGDKIIIFNQFNSQTTKLYWALLDLGLKVKIIHSGISKEERNKSLSDFKLDKVDILLATKVLDEGYNLPKIDTAIIMAGDSTHKQTIQRLGRVLRKKDKDSSLYQLYCLQTIEENQAYERSKLFKSLCSNYSEYTYDTNGNIK